MRKRILGLITLFMIFLVSAPPMTGVLDEPRMAFAPASDVKLKTFNINIEKIDINTPTRSTAVPSAMVTAKVELQNLRMLAIKDVVLSVTLLDQQEKIVSEGVGR